MGFRFTQTPSHFLKPPPLGDQFNILNKKKRFLPSTIIAAHHTISDANQRSRNHNKTTMETLIPTLMQDSVCSTPVPESGEAEFTPRNFLLNHLISRKNLFPVKRVFASQMDGGGVADIISNRPSKQNKRLNKKMWYKASRRTRSRNRKIRLAWKRF